METRNRPLKQKKQKYAYYELSVIIKTSGQEFCVVEVFDLISFLSVHRTPFISVF